MTLPKNHFKAALAKGERQIGCWMSFGEAVTAEVMGKAGFDWLVIDGEHAPNDIRSIRDQLLALSTSSSSAVVRVPIGETWIIKQVLDCGAQTVLVPMVDTAEQAQDLVKAVRYPPFGTRGVGAAAARATEFGINKTYTRDAEAEICLLLQVESRKGIENLDAILAVEGIDGVFIGPADLCTDMGHVGNPGHPEVRDTIKDALARIKAAGVAPGILGVTEESISAYSDMGAQFLAVGIDVLILRQTATQLADRWKSA